MKSPHLITTRHRGARFAVAFMLIGCFFMPLIAKAAQVGAWVPFDLPRLQQTTLTSVAGAPYRIVVATPAGPAPFNGYPVIYVVDGNAWTSLISEIIRTNIETGVQSRVEPAVVVGIGYPIDAAFDLTRRNLDLTSPLSPGPPDSAMTGDSPSGGDIALMNFIDTVVKPVIERRFKIDRSRQTLIGHSLGGLFTLNTMFNRPRSFQTYVALSPSIWWNHRALLQEAQHFVQEPDRPRKLRVFISAGDLEQYPTPAYIAHTRDVFEAEGKTKAEANKEWSEMEASNNKRKMVENARRLAALLTTAHIQTTFVEFPREDHFSVVPAALGRAVPFAVSDDLPNASPDK